VLILALGTLAGFVRVYSKHNGIMTAITIVITAKANQKGTTTAPTARQSTCICEQMPVSELAAIMQGCRQLQSAGRAKKKRKEGIMAKIRQLAQLR
jgi:hypothetical protein